jgi:hypothetical protein
MSSAWLMAALENPLVNVSGSTTRSVCPANGAISAA